MRTLAAPDAATSPDALTTPHTLATKLLAAIPVCDGVALMAGVSPPPPPPRGTP